MKKIPEQDLLAELRRLESQLEKAPTGSEIDDYGEYSKRVYYKRFESLKDAREKAGISRGARRRDSGTDEELISEVHRVKEEIGRVPSTADLEEHAKWCSKTFTDRFGSMKDTREAAGLPREIPNGYWVSDEQLLRALSKLANQLDRTPTADEMNELGPYSERPYHTHFGSWNQALDSAGLDRNRDYATETTIQCKSCGTEFSARPSRVGVKHYCSNECKFEYLSGETHPHWKGGEHAYGRGWNKEKKKAVRRRDGNRCQGCGITQDEHLELRDERLHVHHIKPARRFDDDERRNSMDNLVTLCHSCHRKWEGVPVRPTLAGEAEA